MSDLQKLKRNGRIAYAIADFPRDLLLRLTACPDLPLRMGPAETIKAGNSALVLRAKLPSQQGMVSVAYKRVIRKTSLKRISQVFGHNPTLRSFRMSNRLIELGIPTAKPLAVILPSRLKIHEPSWLITEWIDGAQTLANFAMTQHGRSSLADNSAGRIVAAAVGDLMGRIHANCISHRDLKPQNVLVRSNAQTAEAFLIDLDGAQDRSWISDNIRWKNLSRLAVSLLPLDRDVAYTFLTAYLKSADASIDWKYAWRQLELATTQRRSRRKVA